MNLGDRRGNFQRRSIQTTKGTVAAGVAVILLLSLAAPALAEGLFTAKTLGDHGKVTVMEVSGNYDSYNPDGTVNAGPRQAITKEFFRTHKDEYDFLVIFSNFDFKMPDNGEALAFYSPVKNDTKGIGLGLFDYSGFYGSNGKLQGVVDMGNTAKMAMNPVEPGFEQTLDTISHEMMHRWAAYVKFRDPDGSLNNGLLGRDDCHWSFLLSTDASLMLGNTWQNNGNGTFTSVRARKYYSPLDLYLMGFIDKSQVLPVLLIENSDIDPKQVSEVGVTITGTPRYVTIEDIIAAEGERMPGPAESQKFFKTAFIFITSPGTFSGDELYGLENIRSGWLTRYSVLTDGAGIVDVALSPIENIPANPGPVTPEINPRRLPPSMDEGVKWLVDNQRADGSWTDLPETSPRDTAESVLALKNFGAAAPNSASGIEWLKSASAVSTDYLARRIEALSDSGQDTGALIDDLLFGQNGDGGWGSRKGTMSNPADTALTLKACARAGYAGEQAIANAIEYLKNRQIADGGWGNDDLVSKVGATADVLMAFNRYKGGYPLDAEIGRGAAWLLQRQNADGGFGNSPSTVYDTAVAVLALAELDAPRDASGRAVDYILNQQSADGSWRGSAYQTALAVSAVWKVSVDPDLSVKTDDITFDPATVTTIPSIANVNANISNLGRTDVPAVVALYDGPVSDTSKVGEQIVAFPGQSTVTVRFSASIRDGNEHTFTVLVDPNNLVKESNRLNNTAVKVMASQPTYDFEILPGNVSVSANPVDISKDVTISTSIKNKGTMDAYNVQVKYYIDDLQGAFDIGTATVDIPAGGSVTNEMVWKTNRAGENMPVTVFVDAFNSFVELNEGNNKAAVNLTVNGATAPNLTVSYKDVIITPSPANERGDANISALVKNEGFSAASNIAVNFYEGTPGVDGVLLGSRTVPSLNPGESTRASIDWTDIRDIGKKIIDVRVDPDNLIKETSKDDNDAFVALQILGLPDLAVSSNSIAFSPATPKDGDPIAINVTIKNLGEQAASNVLVKAFEGGAITGSQNISAIAGNSQASTSLTYDTKAKSGAHTITVVVDPDNAIVERSKDNNTAVRTLGVQDANLWVTERHISPNGDGVKDSTQFFFRMDAPQTARVEAVNKKGVAVKTFSGGDLTDTSGGNVTWDGFDDNGRVVEDGPYQIRLLGSNDGIIGSLLVVVDNNRSPFVEAIGTNYLLTNNISCKLPDIGVASNSGIWDWLKDGSGIIFSIGLSHSDSPDYPNGVYAVASGGGDVSRIIPDSWTDSNSLTKYYYFQDYLSPGGQRLAFKFNKYDVQTMTWSNEVWLADADGGNLRPLLLKGDGDNIFDLKWSPDGKKILYNHGPVTNDSGYRAYDLSVVDAETGTDKRIDWGYLTLELTAEWAPDSSSISYLALSAERLAQGLGQVDELKVSDTAGRLKSIYTFEGWTWGTHIYWLGNTKLIADHPYLRPKLLLFDAGGNQSNLMVSDNYEGIFVSHDSRKAFFLEGRSVSDLSESLHAVTPQGDVSLVYRTNGADPDYYWEINSDNIALSSDEQKLSLMEFGRNKRSYQVTTSKLVGIDLTDGDTHSNGSGINRSLYGLLSDGEYALVSSSLNLYDYYGDLRLLVPDSVETMDLLTEVSIPRRMGAAKAAKVISPQENAIAFYRNTTSPGCRQSDNLWLLTSIMNLTADLAIIKNSSSVILKGTAADINFESYTLEYADADDLHTWNLVSLPADMPVINDIFTTWVPPYEGVFYVRLTVQDKAGNTKMLRRRVPWGLSSSITNLYKSTDIFSPNGDGVKDTFSLNYNVLEPVHLELSIYDKDGNLVRTFTKGYSVSGADSIAWDGRDSGGNMVADGKYTIKVFGYEFFVEVDNTPPDANLVISALAVNNVPNTDTWYVSSALRGRAFDRNIKKWTIEYGEGLNPSQWIMYKEGTDQLTGSDQQGIPQLNPPTDKAIGVFSGMEVEFLVGKKLRIAAEDRAGNLGTVVTGMLEEQMIFLYWDDKSFHGELPAYLFRPGFHTPGGQETIRRPIRTLNVQYTQQYDDKTGGWINWVDGESVLDPPSGDVFAKWDNSPIDINRIYAIRLKAVDVDGSVFYSNIVSGREKYEFQADCSSLIFAGDISLYRQFKQLRFQAKSGDDPRYAEWTDIELLHAEDQSIYRFVTLPYHDLTIPEGRFEFGSLGAPAGIPEDQFTPNSHYTFRMVGTFDDGTEKFSNEVVFPSSCNGGLSVKVLVDYPEASGCGMISGKASMGAAAKYDTTSFQAMSLKVYLNEVYVPPSKQSLDTTAMAEGQYPVEAVFEYLDLTDQVMKRLEGTGHLIVDRVLPQAEITYPSKSLMLCPVKVSDAKGDWLSIPVEGAALDNTKVKRYELYYGAGEAPTQWHTALTRVISAANALNVPIGANRSAQGQLGKWDVTDLKGPDYSLMLKVADAAGNMSCYTTSFSIDTTLDIAGLSVDKPLFSPNGDGFLDEVRVDYRIDKYVVVDVNVFKLGKASDGTFFLDSAPVRTIISGSQHLEGPDSAVWDGKGDAGDAVPDGLYGIEVSATDSCGNANAKWVAVEVDNTPPTTLITYPTLNDPLNNIVEAKGTADDLNFNSYTLEAGEGDSPASWQLISSGSSPVKGNVLGAWNTFGLQGRWTMRLTGADTVENINVISVVIDLGQRKDLIKNLSALPRIFSPNNDGRLDTTDINYELTDSCSVKIEIIDTGGNVGRTYVTTVPSAGSYTYTWDGRSDAGFIVPDGIYTAKLTAALSSNPSVNQIESMTLVVDATPPLTDIKYPISNSYLGSGVTVFGTIRDANLVQYSISYTGDSGTVPVASASQSRENYTFDMLNDLPEGNYTLNVQAKDLGENSTEKNTVFTIDRTPPKATFDTPKDGELYGNTRNVINVAGGIIEKNLDTYSLRYGLGDNPSQWTELQGGGAVPANPQLFTWKVDGVPDGIYTLSLYAKDKAGWPGEAKVKIIIDNTPPQAAIASPKDGGYVKAATEIKGTAFDANLQNYTLDISEGHCTGAFKWASLKASASPISDASLGALQALPPDGNYCLRLTVVDKAGSSAQAMADIKIDTASPAPPVLSGKVESKKDSRLTWTAGAESDLGGYDLYRDGQKLNATLLHDTQYLDQNLSEKVYSYVLRATDLAGNESKPSNEVKLKIDLTGPDARIRSPQDGASVSSIVDIKGTVYSADDFKEYRVYIGVGASPSSWMLIRTSPVPTSYGTLAQWDTLGLPEDAVHSIKIEAEDLSGNIGTHQIKVVIDNLPPAEPVLLAAVLNGPDVNLTWKANTEPDLAGYLLYRNEQLVNVAGIVVGNLKPYLLTAAAYLDKSLPDGTYKYYLVAMDRAGNMSGQSNVLEVIIDTHPPHAKVVEPADKSKFDRKTLVRADSPDNDIASIQFLYKKAGDVAWTNLEAPVTKQPYIAYIDPSVLGLSHGDYDLMTVATDLTGNIDPVPTFVTVTYKDIASPAAVQGLKAAVNGKDATLTWTVNTESDLGGYTVYRITDSIRTKLNAAVIKETVYHDNGLADGRYTYEVTASDAAGNEGNPSDEADARVYAPIIDQPYTPSDRSATQLTGGNANAGSSAEIFDDSGSGPVSQGAAQADQDGKFAFDDTLLAGENKLTAVATDAEGNISRTSDMVVVVFSNPPAPPTGLAASAQNYEVALTWDLNSETDIAGYNLYRDGAKLNNPLTAAPSNGSAASTYYNYAAANALDGNPSTYWMSGHGYGTFSPVWFEIGLASRELVDRIEIQWISKANAGRDYEVQAWSGYAWIPVQKVTGNAAAANHFDIKPSYRTDKLRIYMTDTTDPNYSKQVGISEITILKDDLITQTAYNDLALHDGKYSYTATAVNYYGFESRPSTEATTDVGDVTSPTAPLNLAATVTGSDVNLNWAPNAEFDLAGYHLYRMTPQGWNRLNATLIPTTSYNDAGLPNGTYTYRVTAVDTAGNESLPSNEVPAVVYVPDITSSPKPTVFFPTVKGIPVVLQKNKTDVAGFAEPNTVVELFRNGGSEGTTTASKDDRVQQYRKDQGAYGEYLSPDGQKLLYTWNDALWMKDLSKGSASIIAQSAMSEGWSPDGGSFTYYTYGSNWNYHIQVYDMKEGLSSPLTGGVSADEFSPSWSPDGGLIAFTSDTGSTHDVWLKDLTSGSLSQITGGSDVNYVRFSPDGGRLLYADGGGLHLYEISSGIISTVDAGAVSYTGEWSPDGKRVLYTDYRGGSAELFVVDPETQVKKQLVNVTGDIHYLAWSPDGSSAALGTWNGTGYSVLVNPITNQGDILTLRVDLPVLSSLAWSKSGLLTIGEELLFSVMEPKGYFRLQNVALDPGENVFSASATDAAGNISLLSDEITVTSYTALLPDLETTVDDIYLFPAVPLAGQQVEMNIIVWNRGVTAAKDVQADFYITDSHGNMALIKSVSIPNIAPGSGEVIGITWDTMGNAGSNEVTVVLDPGDKMSEVTKSNNYAAKDFIVIEKEGISMTTSLKSDQLKAKENLNVDIQIVNSGVDKAGTLEVSVEDADGYLVSTLNSGNMHIPYGYQGHFALTWNTGSTLAGPYRVHSVLKDTSGVLAENAAMFAILTDVAVKSAIITDKAQYGPHENVSVSYTVGNSGANYIIPGLKATVRITDSLNNELFREEKDIVNALPGATVDFGSIWNTAFHTPGDYTAFLDVYLDGKVISGVSTMFVISQATVISGSMKATPSTVVYGNQLVVDYSVTNTGNSDRTGTLLSVMVLDPATQTIMKSADETVDLPMNAVISRQIVFSTQGIGLKTYVVALRDVSPGNVGNIANTSFTVIDGIPPAIGILSPLPGSHFNSQFSLTVAAADDISGVDKVQYQFDGGIWKALPVSDPAIGRYATAWIPAKTDEGTHTINFRASDKAGNVSNPVSTSITIDLTPPVLTVSTLSDGSWTNNDVLNVAGRATDTIGLRQVTVNGAVTTANPDGTFSYPIVMQDGPNTITVIATDLAGNQTPDTRTINLDRTAPGITIITPVDNMKTEQAPIDVSGAVDEQCSVTVKVNMADPVPAVTEGINFSLPITPVYGINTIEVTATDRAGNTSSAKRTFIFDDKNPSLSVTVPALDVLTNQADMTIQGEVSDITAVTVTITMDGNAFNPSVTNGTFMQPVSFIDEKIYQIRVTAVNEVGSQTVVQRNVVYDITPPTVTIDPVISPTNQTGQVLTGTVDAGVTVSVTCPTAIVGGVTYPTPATWAVELSDMKEGDNQIAVTAADTAGNISQPVIASLVVDITPPLPPVIVSPADGSFALSSMADIKGSAEPGATVQMAYGTTISLKADPMTGEFVFTKVGLMPGQNTFAFTATDAAGNTGGRTLYTLYFDISELLTGAIIAKPAFVYQGKDETLTYSVINSGSGDIAGLTLRVYIVDPDTQSIRHIFENITLVPANTTRTGDFTLLTLDLTPKTYNAVFEVSSDQMAKPKTLASTTFEVKPRLEASKTISDAANLLVWLNKKCHHDGVGHEEDKQRTAGTDKTGTNCAGNGGGEEGGGEEEDCARLDLLERILRQAVKSYLIVYDKIEFQREIRNPYYTDVLVIGDHEPLADHYKDELREKVFSGGGIISSLWSSHGDDYERNDPIFGIKHEGAISGKNHLVLTVPSPITADGSLIAEGAAERVQLKPTAAVAGWLKTEIGEDEDHQGEQGDEYPAIVLNEYGEGKAVYYAFDLGASLDSIHYGQLATLINNSLSHVHRQADTDIFRPGQQVPVGIRLKSPEAAFDLRITETYPAGIIIYDPVAGKWVKDNPWTVNIHLDPGETKTLMYYALLPDKAGTYELKTELGYMDGGNHIADRNLKTDITVGKDTVALREDVITALKKLNFSGKDRANINAAIRYIGYTQMRQANTPGIIERNILHTLKAIDSLIGIESADISKERLLVDEFLEAWESRWYYFGIGN